MALVVEDGSVVRGANSYVSLADANQYLTDRGINVELTEGLLLRGADYVNSFRDRFKGYKQTDVTSNMQWPRAFAVIDNYLVRSNVVPAVIPDAQIQSALEISMDRDPHETTSTQVVKRQKIDVIEIEYDTRAGNEIPNFDYRRIRSLLDPVIDDNYMRVSR